MSRDRKRALVWSYVFLVLFAAFFLMPPLYLLTSLKSSAEISSASNPWWVFSPALDNYAALLTSNQYLIFFRTRRWCRWPSSPCDGGQHPRRLRAGAHEVRCSATLASGVFLTWCPTRCSSRCSRSSPVYG
jgi:multiple sugar transport system permease protein